MFINCKVYRVILLSVINVSLYYIYILFLPALEG